MKCDTMVCGMRYAVCGMRYAVCGMRGALRTVTIHARQPLLKLQGSVLITLI
ncbi:MAG: hypothetical protein IJ667_02860 [Synergistaceae bacterium]|nr:hypothetical protein [Synergistaceae bacterium]